MGLASAAVLGIACTPLFAMQDCPTFGDPYPGGFPFVMAEIPAPPNETGRVIDFADMSPNGDIIVSYAADLESEPTAYIWSAVRFLEDGDGWIASSVVGFAAQAVNDSGTAVGWSDYIDAPNRRAVVDDSGTHYTAVEGEAYDVNNADDGIVVGWSTGGPTSVPVAWELGPNTPVVLPTPPGWTASCALGINPGPTDEYIVGAAMGTSLCSGGPSPLLSHAVLWDSTGFNQVSQDCPAGDEYAAAVNDSQWVAGWRGVAPSLDDTCEVGCIQTQFNSAGVVWEYLAPNWTGYVHPEVEQFHDINSHGEAVGSQHVRMPDAGTLHSLWPLLRLPPEIAGFVVTAITDDLRMAGVARRTDNKWVPIVIEPYDTDHDGEPDFREIVNGEADANENWIPDSNEVQRVGLHAPGISATSESLDIPRMQIVRFTQDYAGIANFNGNVDCAATVDAINAYRSGDGDPTKEREIIITVRTPDPSEAGRDSVPATQTERDNKALQLLQFSARLANCVDYFQIGNEYVQGAGAYLMDDGNGNLMDMQDIPWGQVDDGIENAFDWIDQQMFAVLRGSALAGRPARLIAPAVTLQMMEQSDFDWGTGQVCPGDSQDRPGRRQVYAIMMLMDFANTRAIPMDFHMHYQRIGPPGEPSQYRRFGLDRLVGVYNNSPWALNDVEKPNQFVVLEWGPSPDFSWLEDDQNTLDVRDYYESGTLAPPTWDEFILQRWENGFDNGGNDFRLSDAC